MTQRNIAPGYSPAPNETEHERVFAAVAAVDPDNLLCAHGHRLASCSACQRASAEHDVQDRAAIEHDRAGEYDQARKVRTSASRDLSHFCRRVDIEVRARARAQTPARKPQRARTARRRATRAGAKRASADPESEPAALARPLLVLLHRGDARVDAFVIGGTAADAEFIRRDVERAAAEQGWHTIEPALIGRLARGGDA